MKFLKNHTIPKILILVSMVTCFGVLSLDSNEKIHYPGPPIGVPRARVDPVADSQSELELALGLAGAPQVKLGPVAGWQSKFRGSSHFVNLEPLQAELEKARAHENELDPALRALISEAGEGRDEGLTNEEVRRYWVDFRRRRDPLFAERDRRAAASAVIACEKEKVAFVAIRFCIEEYNVAEVNCIAALGISLIELAVMKAAPQCPR